ncbi:MAG: NIL domain-containing protein [Thermodesulfobacteriota bacterium]
MANKRLVLNFPPHLIDQPVTFELVRKYNLKINILRARITPREQGRLVIEVSGSKKDLEAGLKFLQEMNVQVDSLAQDVRFHEERCTECSACTSICPTGALSVARPEMHVSFNREKCIACELCVPACPYQVMEIVF